MCQGAVPSAVLMPSFQMHENKFRRRTAYVLCSSLGLCPESPFPLLHAAESYLHFKMQLQCRFFHMSFPDAPHIPRGGDRDKLRTTRKESCSIYNYSHCTVSDTKQVFNEHRWNWISCSPKFANYSISTHSSCTDPCIVFNWIFLVVGCVSPTSL